MITDNKNFLSPEDFGRSLKGVSLNFLTQDVLGTQKFLTHVFGIEAVFGSSDFAVMKYQELVFMIHHDGTYHSHPGLSLVPESGPRGGGVTVYLIGVDPDQAVAKTEAAGGHVLEAAVDKPHGLREAAIMDPNGYLWSPVVPIG